MMLHLLLFRAIKKTDVWDVMFHLTVTVSETKHGGAFRFMEMITLSIVCILTRTDTLAVWILWLLNSSYWEMHPLETKDGLAEQAGRMKLRQEGSVTQQVPKKLLLVKQHREGSWLNAQSVNITLPYGNMTD